MRSSIHRTARTVIVAVLLGILLDGAAECAEWSGHAAAVPGNRRFQVPSPDRKRSLDVDGALLTMREAGQIVPGSEGIDILWSAELLWSPDSKAFTLTSRDSAEEGTWDVSVFVVENDRVNYYAVTREAVARFRERFPCMATADPHVGAVRWMKDAKQLLLAIEIPAGSACREIGAYLGALVNVPSGSVVRMYEQAALRGDWGGSLGLRFAPRRP